MNGYWRGSDAASPRIDSSGAVWEEHAKPAPQLWDFRREFVWLVSNDENPHDRERRNRLAEQHGLERVQGRLNLGARRVP